MSRDLKYSVKTLRVSEEIWRDFKKLRDKSGVSWNLFIRDYIELFNKKDFEWLNDNKSNVSMAEFLHFIIKKYKDGKKD